MYRRPAALSIFHRYRYLSVLSNAQDHQLSKCSLPNVREVVSLSLPCPEPVVLSTCQCTRSSANVFAYTWSRTAFPAGMGLHPTLRIFGSIVKYHVSRFTSWCRRHDFVVHIFLNMFNHVYAILKYCYLFHRLSVPSPTLLCVETQRSFFLQHDFKALMLKLSRKVFFSPINCLQTVALKCLCSPSQRRRNIPGAAALRFRLGCRKPSRCLKRFPCLISDKDAKPPVISHMGVGHVGGGSRRRISWTLIDRFVKSTPITFDKRCMLLYAAHVDEIGLKNYPPSKYVYATIPLISIVDVLSLANVRAIATLHGIAVGSRCNAASLKSYVAKHSCSKCTGHVTVFSFEKNAAEKQVDRTVKSVAKANALKASDKKPTTTKKEIPATNEINISFPPEPASKDLEHAIIRDACKRMDPENFEEVGCAVCGELKLRKNTSRLKSVKNLLKILEIPGVTRIERKLDNSPIREYKGPVLDYGCSDICNECRGDIRRGKVPRLALSNNLWLGAVPNVLKNLTFVEKILVARVRHTCAFVKVSTGMRKMKANIVAFESPIQKIYNILPPPREELDEVLAILFTGPAKPTEKDFARTPFLVRRNAVITALEWLRLNHSDYAGIEISHQNASQYCEDMPPVSVEYQPKSTNKVPEGTSVFNQEEEDGTVEGDCVFTVHGLTGELCNSMTPSALKAMALRHLNSGGKILAVGHSDKLESISDVPAPAWPGSPGFGLALDGSGFVKSQAGPKAEMLAWPGLALA